MLEILNERNKLRTSAKQCIQAENESLNEVEELNQESTCSSDLIFREIIVVMRVELQDADSIQCGVVAFLSVGNIS